MKKIYVLLISIFLTVNLLAQTNDIGIYSILQPSYYICDTVPVIVRVRIHNYGTQMQTSFPLTYRRGLSSPVTEVCNYTLFGGDSCIYTFQTKMTVPLVPSISLCVYTELTSDLIKFNDTLCETKFIRQFANPDTIYGPSYVNPGSIITYISDTVINATNYYWLYNPNNGVTITSNNTIASVHFGLGASSGVLSVWAKDSACYSLAKSLNINIGTGINEINNNSFLLSQNTPNPASSNTNIEYNSATAGNVKFELINLLGDKIMAKTLKAESGINNLVLDVSGLSNGIYYYSMEYKGKMQFRKLMVSK